MLIEQQKLTVLLEAILLAAGKPMTEEQILAVFPEETKPDLKTLKEALSELQRSMADRGVELVHIASGYRFQAKQEWAPWISKLWEEKAQKYSRALLETLALIAYRQPITRGEIEDIRGVAVSSSIIKTLLEDREWIRVVGHKEVPGRPALYATTKAFLDYFGLQHLQDLPSLPEIMNLDVVEADLAAEQQKRTESQWEAEKANAMALGEAAAIEEMEAQSLKEDLEEEIDLEEDFEEIDEMEADEEFGETEDQGASEDTEEMDLKEEFDNNDERVAMSDAEEY